MALTYSGIAELGSLAPDFNLPGVDGQVYSLAAFQKAKALVVVFMCNHCPYVKAVQGRINALAQEYLSRGVMLVGINSNDTVKYPDDSFEAMKQVSRENHYIFPYLLDESQEVARAYGAACTPDFFVYQNESLGSESLRFSLKYRGRLDDSWKDEKAVTRRDLALALNAILSGQLLSSEQISSMGCNIKWK